MKLTKKEQGMLDGKEGEATRQAMEFLVELGEAFDAEKMVPVKSGHVLYPHAPYSRIYVKDLADKGGKFQVYAECNPLRAEQLTSKNDYVRMGMMLSNTCVPYLVGHVPRVGEHCAWSESSAAVYVNSVLGARTNKESGFSSLAAALTGRTPAYGYHLDENRWGDMEIHVTAKLNGIADYGSFGLFVGKKAQGRVPVIVGIPESVSIDELKYLGSEADFAGTVPLFHVVGVTPEAQTKAQAYGKKKPSKEIYHFSQKDLEECEAALSLEKNPKADIVLLGCPHASITEIEEVARILEGKKLKAEFSISTAHMIKVYAERMGYLKIIEDAGGKILSETCPVAINSELDDRKNVGVVVTNSAKLADHMPEKHRVCHYGSTRRCVEAAITGIWR